MASYTYYPVCQWCGQIGGGITRNVDTPPVMTPKVSGKCKSHPSGKPNMEHAPRWERR